MKNILGILFTAVFIIVIVMFAMKEIMVAIFLLVMIIALIEFIKYMGNKDD